MSKLWIERDVEHWFGYYVKTNTECVAYTFTKWGAKRVYNRYKNLIVEAL